MACSASPVSECSGVVADALLDEFQLVIKPPGKMFRKVDYVSGSSILGTGEAALILDVPALVRPAISPVRNRAPSAALNSIRRLGDVC